ncbi:hypothetical protein ABH926_007312 [Catenulispora sp. GP43]|uniref:hypothetical protein n=1 Tax=Catenulispora sp. GP43 TaxID=3156263 RepID=UPI00351577C2
MSNSTLRTRPKHASEGPKRLRRALPLVTSAALSASLIAAAAGTANAAVQPAQPAQSAPGALAAGQNAAAVASLVAATHYIHLSDGHFTLDTQDARKAGVDPQSLNTADAFVASLNKLPGHAAAPAAGAHGTTVGFAAAVPAAAQNTTITVLPGITLTIGTTGVQLNMTKQAVIEVESVVGFGQNVATLVGAILTAAQVPLGGPIAGIVAGALGLGNGLLKVCTAGDGSATFTVPWFGIPSCSGLSSIF